MTSRFLLFCVLGIASVAANKHKTDSECEPCWEGSEPRGTECECPCWDRSWPVDGQCPTDVVVSPCGTIVCSDGNPPPDETTCECSPEVCWDGSKPDSLGDCPRCKRRARCREGYEWDKNSCSCEEIAVAMPEICCAMACLGDQVLDCRTCSCQPIEDEFPICTMDLCWDGSSRNPRDCSCPPEPPSDEICCEIGCIGAYKVDCKTCSCVPIDDDDFPVCTEDLCWDGNPRDPKDCSCPEPIEEPCCEMACIATHTLDCKTCTCVPIDDDDFPECTEDLCWDGSSRDPKDCSCPSCDNLVFIMDPCEVGQSWSYEHCQCKDVCMVKDAFCHRGYEWNDRQCKCIEIEKQECSRVRKCKNDKAWDDEKCECVDKCSIVARCYAGYAWDAFKCDCVLIEEPTCTMMQATCYDGYDWDESVCNCVRNETVSDDPHCQGQCELGYIWDENQCTCLEDTDLPEICCMIACMDGLTLDCATCTCIPDEPEEVFCDGYCRDGSKPNMDDCSCGDCVKDRNCYPTPPNNNAWWSWWSCTCEQIYQDPCDYIMICDEGQEWDFDVCGCVDMEPYYCDEPECWDGSQPDQSCECPSCSVSFIREPCVEGYEWNMDECRCTKIPEMCCRLGCPVDQVLNCKKCRCEEKPFTECSQKNLCWDGSLPQGRDCICPPKPLSDEYYCNPVAMCAPGYYWSERYCDCIEACTIRCSDEYVLNELDCTCEKRRPFDPLGPCEVTCADGYWLHDADCQCHSLAEPTYFCSAEACPFARMSRDLDNDCECTCDACPNTNFRQRKQNCQCKCPRNFKCDKGQYKDKRACECLDSRP